MTTLLLALLLSAPGPVLVMPGVSSGGAVGAQLHLNDNVKLSAGNLIGDPDVWWMNNGTVFCLTTTDSDASLTDANLICYTLTGNQIMVGATAATADFANARMIVSHSDSGITNSNLVGVVGEAAATAATRGVGVYGVGTAHTTKHGYGFQSLASVNATGDTGTAYGIYAFSGTTHAGGPNVGGAFWAAGSSTANNAIQIDAGDINTVAAADWDLLDNDPSALSWDSAGKSGIMEIITTDDAEAVSFSGNIILDGAMHSTHVKGSLPDNTATGFVRISVPTDTHQGGSILYGVHAQNASDVQSTNGMVNYSLINDAGTEACDVQESVVTQSSVGSAGSLGVTFTCDASPGTEDVVDILVTSNTTLGTLTAHEIHYTMIVNDITTITGL